MNQPHADKVWNRAAMEDGGTSPLEGDLALTSMLLAHGLIMNGGLHHAIDCLEQDEISAAVNGYMFFELSEIGEFIKSVASGLNLTEWNTENELTANATYSDYVPSDEFLGAKFEAKYKSNPEKFSSVDD